MRSLHQVGVLVSCTTIQLACGSGQSAREGAQSPDTTSTTASTPSDASAGTQVPNSSVGTTTTTATLSDAGDLQGAKLTETHTVATASASAEPGSKTPHTHDPGRGPDDIRAIVIAHKDEARACYDRALPEHPGIEGDVVITWTIDSKGNVTETSFDSFRSEISEPSVVACLSQIIKRIRFAPSPGGFETKASYPFKFHPRHNKHAP